MKCNKNVFAAGQQRHVVLAHKSIESEVFNNNKTPLNSAKSQIHLLNKPVTACNHCQGQINDFKV